MSVGVERSVETVSGMVRGVSYGGVSEFVGLPYGGQVDAEHRFGPPTPAPTWTGERPAVVYGPAAPQRDARVGASDEYVSVLHGLFPGTAHALENRPQDENCLYLNVWAPAPDNQPATEPKAVMVWLHGGGFVHGTGAEGWSHGANLARHGDVVVVKVNHRLGLLGFMPSGPATSEVSGIAGMLDIVQALEWVRDNIAAFGGDPDNVTIFGQSGGAFKVSTLTAMPSARGLFHKAVMQSGPGLNVGTEEAGEKLLSAVLRGLDLAPSEADKLARVPTRQLLDIQGRLGQIDPTLNPMAIGPQMHAELLPRHIADPDFDPAVADVPLIVGHTTHEFAFMMAGEPAFHQMSRADLPALFAQHFGDDGEQLLTEYRSIEPDDRAQLVIAAAVTDRLFVRPTRSVLEAKARQAAPVFSYRYDYRPQILGGILGAHHTLAIPFIFGNMSYTGLVGEADDRHRLSAAMLGAWAEFARTGTPAADSLPKWTPWTSDKPDTMVLNSAPVIEQDRQLLPAVEQGPSLF